MANTSGAWPSTSANSFRREYLAPAGSIDHQDPTPAYFESSSLQDESHLPSSPDVSATTEKAETSRHMSTDSTVGSSPSNESSVSNGPKINDISQKAVENASDSDNTGEDERFAPIKTVQSKPPVLSRTESRAISEKDLFKALSRRRTNASGQQGSFTTGDDENEQAEIERLVSRMFGKSRQEQSEDEKTKHTGLVFKNITVKGMGLGAALQGTLGDPFLALPRLFKSFFRRGFNAATGKPPVRTILNDFTGSIRPGEMLLVLGRPGSGCSTFLKVLANQRFGFESISGDVSYGGTDAKVMGKDYRGEIVYNPEDDLHYATLSVKRTLAFALKTRTPGKASRNEGESRADYVKEFLRVVSKLFWIEHTSSYREINFHRNMLTHYG